jgi:hypothetical protein
MELMLFGAWKWHRFTFIESGFLRVHLYLSNIFLQGIIQDSHLVKTYSHMHKCVLWWKENIHGRW